MMIIAALSRVPMITPAFIPLMDYAWSEERDVRVGRQANLPRLQITSKASAEIVFWAKETSSFVLLYPLWKWDKKHK